VIPTLEALGIDRLSINEKLELIARIWESLPPDVIPELPSSGLDDLKRYLSRPAEENERLDRDWTLACAINREALHNPQSPYAWKWVGIANGQVVVVSDDPDEVEAQLMRIATDEWSTMSFRAGANLTPAERV
jgi:hypothetical protein